MHGQRPYALFLGMALAATPAALQAQDPLTTVLKSLASYLHDKGTSYSKEKKMLEDYRTSVFLQNNSTQVWKVGYTQRDGEAGSIQLRELDGLTGDINKPIIIKGDGSAHAIASGQVVILTPVHDAKYFGVLGNEPFRRTVSLVDAKGQATTFTFWRAKPSGPSQFTHTVQPKDPLVQVHQEKGANYLWIVDPPAKH